LIRPWGEITRSRSPRRGRFLGTVVGTLTLSTHGRIGMEISVIEQVLRDAVRRGVLDEADVNAAVDGMWGARATFQEAIKTPQDRESKMAAAIEEFNEVSTDVIALLNRAASA
jgi:hypothetical protein